MTPETAPLIPEVLMPEDLPLSLAQIENAPLPELYRCAKAALAQLEMAGLKETKALGDAFDVIASLARQAKDATLLNQALRYRARCERQLGIQLRELRAAGKLHQGSRSQLDGRDSSGGYRALPPENEDCPTLAEVGISKRQSVRAQALASLPQEDFEAAVEADPPPSLSALAERARSSKPAGTESPRQPVDPFREGVAEILAASERLRKLAEHADAAHADQWGPMLSNAVANLRATQQVLAEQAGGRVVLRFQDGRVARNPDAGDFEMVPLAFATRERDREGRRHG